MYQQIFDKYSAVLSCSKRLKCFSYKASPHYLVPRFKKHSPTLRDDLGVFLIGDSGRAKSILPYAVETPKELLLVYVEAIHRHDGVFDISEPYAKALEKMGYTARLRPWGARDFVIKTQTLVDLTGKKFRQQRNEQNKLLRLGAEIRPVTPADKEGVDVLEQKWAEQRNGRVGNLGYAGMFLEEFDSIPEAVRACGVGVWIDKELHAVALGNMLSEDYWTTGYGLGTRDYVGVSTLAWRELAKVFADVPYEVDGEGGAPTSGIYQQKERYVCEEVLPLQKQSYVVTL